MSASLSIDQILDVFKNRLEKKDYQSGDLIPWLLQELQKQHPCTPFWFKREVLNIYEATLIYYNLNPDSFNYDLFSTNYRNDINEIIRVIDCKNGIYRNLQNHLQSKSLPFSISLVDFINFLKTKKFPIPVHLLHFEHNFASPSQALEQKQQRKLLPTQEDAFATKYFYRYLQATRKTNFTPGQFVASKEFEIFSKANKICYESKTIKKWLKEDDPRPIEKRQGRPKIENPFYP